MMAMRALYITNAREFLRDRMGVLMVLALPSTLAVFFGLIFDSGTLHVPGMLGVAILWLGLFGTALPLMQLRSGQVLRRLRVTPLRPATMLGAQIGWRVTIGLLQAALLLVVGHLAFGTSIQGNGLLFVAAVTLGALVFVSMGLLLAAMVTSEEALVAIAQLLNFPLMMLSGGLFPIEQLPSFLQPAVHLSPLTYLTDALAQLMAGAPGLHPLWLDFGVLSAWFAVLLVLGIRFWRWE